MGAEQSKQQGYVTDLEGQVKKQTFTSYTNTMPPISTPAETGLEVSKTTTSFEFSYPKISTFNDDLTSDVQASLPTSMNTQIQKKPLDEITDFPKFPAEVRQMIWEFSIPGPRVIGMDRFYKEHQDNKSSCGQINKSRQAPAILHACAESRKAGQVVYVRQKFKHRSGFAEIYIDVSRDTIYFKRLCMKNHPTAGPAYSWMYSPSIWDFPNIQHMAFGKNHASWLNVMLSRGSIQLKTVTIVREKYDNGKGTGLERRFYEKRDTDLWKQLLRDKPHLKDIEFRWMSYHPETGLVPSHFCSMDCTMNYYQCYKECKKDLELFLIRMKQEESSDDEDSDGEVEAEGFDLVDSEIDENEGDGDEIKGEDSTGKKKKVSGTFKVEENQDETSERRGGEDFQSGDASSAADRLGDGGYVSDSDDDYFLEDESFPNPRIHIDISSYRQRIVQAKAEEERKQIKRDAKAERRRVRRAAEPARKLRLSSRPPSRP